MCNWETQEQPEDFLGFTPEKIIGEADSHDEWSEEQEEPVSKFVHTDSYRSVCDKGTLFVFGRRGTGKSAILQMLNYEINNKENSTYDNSVIIKKDETFRSFASQIRNSPLLGSPMEELTHKLKGKWSWVIKISGMYAIFKDEKIEIEEKRKITRYLKSLNLIKKNGHTEKFVPLAYVTDILTKELNEIDHVATKISLAIFRITKHLLSPGFSDAEAEMYSILNKNKQTLLVLVDSMDRYNLKDRASEAVTISLISALLDLYTETRNKGLYAKAFFPSEIIPHMSPDNWAKTNDKLHVIRWSYDALVRMLAKRFYKSIVNTNANKAEIKRFCEKLPDSLYQYFPKNITTKAGIKFDTMAYIIAHTQKKPREVILLMNSILTLAKKISVDIKQLDEKTIVDGVHVYIEALFRDCANVYENIYPEATNIIKKALSESKAYFYSNELDVMLQEVNTYTRKGVLSKEEVKRLFLESGVVGIIKKEVQLMNSSKKIITGLFEYQVKGTLAIQNKSKCVIHPMFYQALRIRADMDSYVYPFPAEDDMKYFNKAINEN